MKRLPSRLRRLDGALADLPLEEPMLLTELDGFLAGVLVCPERVEPAEWMRNVWGSDEGGVAPFDDPLDVQWFADAVAARHAEIARDLGHGRFQPLFDIDERNGDMVWEAWIGGFAEAMALRRESWATFNDDPDAAGALARLSTLIAVAFEESELDSVEINALQDEAPAALTEDVACLFAARVRLSGVPASTPQHEAPAKIGRNDPCSCGSGRKSKRCCG